MKKNWMQIVTLCLSAILLVVTIDQSTRLKEYQQQMENNIESLKWTVYNDVQSICNRIEGELEEANRVVSEYALEPTGLDKESRSLQSDVSVTLKEWYEDTEVTLLATMGEVTVPLSMTSDGNGTFTGQLSLSVEDNYEIFLNALISGGGLTKKEILGSWGNVFMLLPLQNGGGGWSGPDYHQGVLSSQFNITIRGQNGVPGPIKEPKFQVYKNGELAQTLSAVVHPYESASDGICYTVDTEDNLWSMECDIEDVIDIHFLCEDEYGLGYDFPFQSWNVGGETPDNQASGGASSSSSGATNLRLIWPE